MVRSIIGDRRIAACLLAVLVVLAMSWGAARAEAATEAASVTIATDSGDQALFSSSGMRPGVPESTCLSVTTAQARYGEVVAVTALDVSGPLAAQLNVTVDRGTGGGGGSCVGFSGSEVFSGTLATLGRSLAADGVDTGWYAELETMQVFRITVTVPDDAGVQGMSAAGRFTWLIRPGSDPPPPGEPPTPSPTPPDPGPTGLPEPAGPGPAPDVSRPAGQDPTVPGPTGRSGPGPAPQVTGTAPVTLRPTDPPPTPGATRVATDQPAADGDDAVEDGGGALVLPTPPPAQAEPADVVIDTALPVALTRTLVALGSDPQYPIAVIVVVLAFLLVQHGIDARDPKLAAAAATQRDNELSFEDHFAPNGRRPEPGTG